MLHVIYMLYVIYIPYVTHVIYILYVIYVIYVIYILYVIYVIYVISQNIGTKSLLNRICSPTVFMLCEPTNSPSKLNSNSLKCV